MEVRCRKCNKLLGYINGTYEIKCPRCGEINLQRTSLGYQNVCAKAVHDSAKNDLIAKKIQNVEKENVKDGKS